MADRNEWELNDADLDNLDLSNYDPNEPAPEIPADLNVDEEIAASLDAYMRQMEANWNRNLSTPVSLDKEVRSAPAVPVPDEPTRRVPIQPDESFAAPAEEGSAEAEDEADEPDGEAEDFEEVEDSSLPRSLKVCIYFACVFLASILLALGAWLAAEDVLALTKPDRSVTVTVSETDTIDDIAQTLYDNGLIEYKGLFKLYCWFAKADEKITAGEYELNNQYDYHALVSGMRSSYTLPDTVTVTIPEGYECSDIFALLEENGVCSAEELSEAAANYEFSYDFLEDLPYGESNRLEGYLFPDTYEFYVGDDPEDVLDRFLSNFNTKFDSDMLAQMEVLNDSIREKLAGKNEEEIEDHLMTVGKIVIIASLIEKEAAVSSERTTISSVIHNRLTSDLYPYLEIDATIQYVLDDRKDVLSYSDLEIDSPYNTYLYEGLPVGAICNPGLSCLKAALYPSETNYYYYALNSEGVHSFFETSVEHQEFVNSSDYAGSTDTDASAETDGETETQSDTETDTDGNAADAQADLDSDASSDSDGGGA